MKLQKLHFQNIFLLFFGKKKKHKICFLWTERFWLSFAALSINDLKMAFKAVDFLSFCL